MLNLDQKGIAGVTVAVAAVAIAGGSVGTPMAVDSYADQQPDSALYGLEKAGETLKETIYAGGQDWEIDRANERTSEFKNMAEKGKANKYKDLLDQAGDRLNNAVEAGKNANGLQKAKNAIDKHTQVLENVQEKVDNHAKAAISLAISRSAQGKAVVTSVISDNVVSKAERSEVRSQVREIARETRRLRNRVRENLKQGMGAGQVIQNINMKTCKGLTEKVQEIAEENEGPAVQEITEMAENHLTKTVEGVETGEGLQKAENMLNWHIQVLENVQEKVDNHAKAAISLAISRSSQVKGIVAGASGGGTLEGKLSKETVENLKYQIENVKGKITENLGPEGFAHGITEKAKKQTQEHENQIENIIEEKNEEYENQTEKTTENQKPMEN